VITVIGTYDVHTRLIRNENELQPDTFETNVSTLVGIKESVTVQTYTTEYAARAGHKAVVNSIKFITGEDERY